MGTPSAPPPKPASSQRGAAAKVSNALTSYQAQGNRESLAPAKRRKKKHKGGK